MPDFKYCPICASPLLLMQPSTEDRTRLVCAACGYIHYVNPKIVSGVLPVQDGRVWLLRRGIEPRYGYWTHPAGYQEWGESTGEAAVREAHEELGCTFVLRGLLGVYSRAEAPVVNVVYMAALENSDEQPHVTPEATEVRAFSPHEIPWHELAFASTEQALRDWIDGSASLPDKI